MSAVDGVTPHGRWQRTPQVALLLGAAAAAWFGVVVLNRGMGTMASPAALGFVTFLATWALMMGAMMLPSAIPVVSLYSRSFYGHRNLRLVAVTAGYLSVWTISGAPAYALAWAAWQTVGSKAATTALALTILLFCGVYQLTPLKRRCLTRCRSPLWLALRYSAYHGRCRDFRAGLHNGAYCLACCWPLMSLMAAFATMSLVAMVGLAVVVVVEKSWRHGPDFARAVGLAALALAVAVAIDPALAAGLSHSGANGISGAGMTQAMPMRHLR